MERYKWNRLNAQEKRRYAKAFARMEFAMYGFDVHEAKMGNEYVDFTASRQGEKKEYDVKVKSSQDCDYIFFQKDRFHLRDNLLAAVVLYFDDKPPQLYLIPSIDWHKPNELLVDRDYKYGTSKSEWGVEVSRENQGLLDKYQFEPTVQKLSEELVAAA